MTARKPPPSAAPLPLIIQGASVQQAIQKALTQLQATRNQVRVTVLSEGQPGLFGMRGKKKAKIRVTWKETPRTPTDKKHRNDN